MKSAIKNFLTILIENALKLFFLFPIKHNRVFFSAFSGRNYACNPKYICEWLLENSEPDLDIVWAFNNPSKFTYLDGRIKRVKFKSIKHIYLVLTSKVVIDNVESWSILPKRKDQENINTWHGGGAYKGVGLQRHDTNLLQNKNMLRKHNKVTTYISSSRAFTEMTLRGSFGYTGEVLEIGMPRNDILLSFTPLDKQSCYERIKVDPKSSFALYAPTFRADKTYTYDLDYAGVLQALEQRFGGDWTILVRMHYYRDASQNLRHKVIDVSSYPDMQELLLISDVLITDYSSSIWDFSLMMKPGFLFTPDLKSYHNERDFYTPIETWPYAYSTTEKTLLQSILTYDQKENEDRIRKHHIELESFETGIASQLLGEFICNSLGMEG